MLNSFADGCSIGELSIHPPPVTSTNWYCRTDGDNANGGGYDAAIASAGTNYCDQAAAELTLTDLATSEAASTELTSETGGFTAAMIGNCYRISAGTNFAAGYYFITSYTNRNTVGLDRTPTPSGAGSDGVGKLGGAFLGLTNLMAGAANGLSNPTITSPLAAGHTIWLRGSGSEDGSTDYDYSGVSTAYQGYWVPAPGSATVGRIKLRGYNGRPCILFSGLLFFNTAMWEITSLKFLRQTLGTGWLTYGVTNLAGDSTYTDCIFDNAGRDAVCIAAATVVDCEFRDSVGGSAGTAAACNVIGYPGLIIGSTAKNLRGHGFLVTGIATAVAIDSIAANCGGSGFLSSVGSYGFALLNCTSYGCANAATLTTTRAIFGALILNCNFDGAGAGNGINCSTGTEAANEILRQRWGYNNIYNCTSLRVNVAADASDLNVNPSFTNAAGGDFSVGAALFGEGLPSALPGLATTSYVTIGAVQRPGYTAAEIAAAVWDDTLSPDRSLTA